MKRLLLLLFSAASITQAAVRINPDGLGEVLLLPYYTTNNGLNTLVTVSNTTDMVKAVKITFREGRFESSRYSLNVYLAPNDSWAFGLVNNGNDSAVISHDLSCVPMFSSPMVLTDHTVDPPPPDGYGYAEGMIEVYEMGELDPSFGYGRDATFVDGAPVDCNQLEANWVAPSGAWYNGSLNQMLPVTGGLKASVSLINVDNGINHSYEGIALNDFYLTDQIIHESPYSNDPQLWMADNISLVNYQGQSIITQWDSGIEAVSALLTQQTLITDYSYELTNNAQSEVVLVFPTKNEHLSFTENPEPFDQPETLVNDCEGFVPSAVDRDGQVASYVPPNVSPAPPHLCKMVNVVKIWDHYDSETIHYPILDSNNTYNQSIIKGKEGMYEIGFNQFTANGRSLDGGEIHTYHGLPVFALTLFQYTNANAQPGLLAQYGGVYVPSAKRFIEIESVQ